MTDVKKFLFDKNDFNNVESNVDKTTYTEEQLVLAKEQSFESGKLAGLQEAKLQQEELIYKTLDKTLQLTQGLTEQEAAREVEKSTGSVMLTIEIIRKLLPGLAAKYSLDEIENIIINSIETRRDEARIAVTIPTEHMDFLKSKIDIITAEKGYTGKIILLTDDNLAQTDCRVEWADGGAERLYQSLFSNIESVLNKAILGLDSNIEEIPENSILETSPDIETQSPEAETNITPPVEEEPNTEPEDNKT